MSASILILALLILPIPEPFPSRSNLAAFPTREVATQVRAALRAQQAYLEWFLPLVMSRADKCRLGAQLAEVGRRYEVWDKLDDCHCWPECRENLRMLLDMLGEDAFRRGEMPPIR